MNEELKYKYLSILFFSLFLITVIISYYKENKLHSYHQHQHHHHHQQEQQQQLLCFKENQNEENFNNENNIEEEKETNPIVLTLFTFIFFIILSLIGRRAFLFWDKEIKIYLETKERQNKDEFSEMEYFLYRLDYLYSHDEKFKAAALFNAAIFLIVIGGTLWWLSTDDSLIESFWAAWTFIADPGTHADNRGLMQRLVSLLMTLGGMVIFAMLIGIISEDIGSFVDNLREGKSRVIVSNHTLILGQGDMLIPIIEQIALANESEGGGSIVILTQCAKLELEATINAAEINLRGSDVIIRTGVPHLQSDLKNVSAAGARAVIVLADKNTSADADAADINTVRTVLSLRGMGAPSIGHIVAEVLDVDNEPLVKIVGKNSVETFVSHDVIGRLMIQCARERGLAQVLEKLLGFEGCEFYIKEWPELVGLKFGQIIYRFEEAIVVGVIRHGHNDIPITLLNPSNELLIQDGDRIVVIAEDDNTYNTTSTPLFEVENLNELLSLSTIYRPRRKTPEKLLFVGWRRDMEDMIAELDSSVAQGSQLTLFNQLSLTKRQERLETGGRKNETKNLTILNVCGNPTTRRDLEKLPLEDYNSILILADQDFEHEVTSHHDMMHADSRSLTSLLLIRDIQNRRNVRTRVKGRISIFDANFTEESRRAVSPGTLDDITSPTNSRSLCNDLKPIDEDDEEVLDDGSSVAVISEILDVRTKPLISVASVTDYVTSNELLSMAIAMVAEQREVNHILKQLLSSEGNEIYLVPMSTYIKNKVDISFYEIMAITNRKNHLTIGYKVRENIIINPTEKSKKMKWSSSTELIIIALDLD